MHANIQVPRHPARKRCLALAGKFYNVPIGDPLRHNDFYPFGVSHNTTPQAIPADDLGNLPAPLTFAEYQVILTKSKSENQYGKMTKELQAAYDQVAPLREKCVAQAHKK